MLIVTLNFAAEVYEFFSLGLGVQPVAGTVKIYSRCGQLDLCARRRRSPVPFLAQYVSVAAHRARLGV